MPIKLVPATVPLLPTNAQPVPTPLVAFIVTKPLAPPSTIVIPTPCVNTLSLDNPELNPKVT